MNSKVTPPESNPPPLTKPNLAMVKAFVASMEEKGWRSTIPELPPKPRSAGAKTVEEVLPSADFKLGTTPMVDVSRDIPANKYLHTPFPPKIPVGRRRLVSLSVGPAHT